ncbi:FHA domain-containing protein [Planomonospora venezuelensis]|uniref:PSer/pThr/pTyr-binding forkhead associated (FHA) protein n=1 Tax=Planomonospora venezuelensis TaxID=1999 RepID=A0A841D6X6_PLAVE|nr:FHA domain-containing protein [Planomonospora venezuelensis]MBB5964663.1 pSer/pThr/pTyr-binding forkhead associated (FHA) protein [Planomonospora venezuelensis]
MIAQGGPDSERVLFPPYCPRRDIPLAGPEIRIGRPSRSRNLVPEIDLSGPPEDPGVSHLHAVLLPGPGGGWTLVDPGSANGTVVNGRQIGINEPVPVGDGDRIHLGAWTLITLRRRRET